jgi:hypothetical protein
MALTKAFPRMIEAVPISIKDFGAVGDGVADDTAAIQAAIDSGAASVYAPAGTYKITSTININRPMTFFGEGKSKTIFSRSTNFDSFYVHDGLNTVMSYVKLHDFQVLNTEPTRANITSGAGIKLYKTYFSHLSQILIRSCYVGIDSQQSNVVTYDGVDVTLFKYVGYYFHDNFGFDSYVSNCLISGNSADRTDSFACVYMNDMCDEMLFYGVIMNMSEYNVVTDSPVYAVNRRPEFCRFISCSFDSSVSGVKLDHCTDMTFTGCFFSNRPGNGLQVGFNKITENVVFQGCMFFNNGGSGAVIGSFAKDTMFNNCSFIGNSTTVLNTGNGLTVAANTTDFTITNCNFRNGHGSSGSQNYGLAVLSGTGNRFVIANNNFGTNGAGGAVLMGATGGTVHVANNIGFVTKNSGTATMLNGTSSIVVNHGLGGQPVSQDIIVTPRLVPTVDVYISALSSTTFTIATNAPVGADRTFNWVATILRA